MIQRRPLLLTFDVEEFDLPAEVGRPLSRDVACAVTDDGVRTILPLLESHAVRATFFVTGRFAAAKPECVRAIADAGHEIGAHGLIHSDDYGSMDSETAVARLRRVRALLDQVVGVPPLGVRTPRLRTPSAAVLRRAGFTYDASPHPTWMPLRYNGLRLPRAPWRESDLIRIPISVVPGLRWPISWLWFRALGFPLNVCAASAASCWAPYLHLYFHPWEATDIRAYVPAWLAVRTGAPFLMALEQLLDWADPRFELRSVGDVAAEVRSRNVRGRATTESSQP